MVDITIGGTYFAKVYGASGPGPIWRIAMRDALLGVPPSSFSTVSIPVPHAPDPDKDKGKGRPGRTPGGPIGGGITIPGLINGGTTAGPTAATGIGGVISGTGATPNSQSATTSEDFFDNTAG
jgi:hypothetical protein